jgi:eukaryotic-like serine/threonine-protein kinase
MQGKLDAWLTRYALPDGARDELLSLLGELQSGPDAELPAASELPPSGSASIDPVEYSSVPPAPSLSSRYEGGTFLGAGSMGEVRRVRDRVLNRSVAVKVLRHPVAGSTQLGARFVQEAQITAQLQHQGIVPVYEMGYLEDGRPYFTMREVRGRTLRQVIRSVHEASQSGRWQQEPGGWSLRRLLEAFHSSCEAVAYAHARGVIHRDIKPSNIMLGEYGEVLVLDWGVAKLLNEERGGAHDSEAVLVTANRMVTKSGIIAGTLAYMAPEQALGEAVTPAADVFSLGAVLYEILCNRPPFENREASTISDRQPSTILPTLPVPEFARERPIAEDLQAICMRALAQDPAARYPDAASLAEDVAAWLEGAKSRARAEAILSEAAGSLVDLEQLGNEARDLAARASAILSGLPSFLPVEAKAPAWELEERATELERVRTARSVKVGQNLRAALAHDAELGEAHSLLADHYLAEHKLAERAGKAEDAARLALLIQDHDRGKHGAYLKGDGALTVTTNPAGAEVLLHKYELRERRLQLGAARALGRTPIHARGLEMGSYLLVLRAEGCQPVHYPVFIDRLEHWDGVPPDGREPEPIYLPRLGDLDPDECYVPAGWFWSGGDWRALGRRSVMPRRRIWLDGFVMRRHHVTIGDYVTFLNALVREGREEEASVAAPRAAGQQQQLGQLLLERRADGTFFVPPNNYFGIPWQEDWPIIFVDWHGAMAYARYKATLQQRPYRLSTELEWEKAARGVDGRSYPWGNFLDPSWCRMLETHAAFPTMAPAGSYAVDESPYGIRDLAGNQRDWCLDVPSEQGPPVSSAGRLLGYHDSHEAWNVRVARGGNFLDSPLWCSAYHRSSFLPHVRDYIVSFRTTRSINGEFPRGLLLAGGGPG